VHPNKQFGGVSSPSSHPLFTWLGFDARIAEERACFAPAAALALALAALPFLLHLLVDTDRALPVAFLPALWLGWKIPKPAHRLDAWLLAWAVAAMLISATFAPHAARAFVMTAAVGWTIAGALVARNLAACTPAIRLILIGMVAGAIVGVVMVRFGVGAQRMFFPTYWSARLFGAHEFAGCIAVTALLHFGIPHRVSRTPLVLAAAVVWTGLAWSGSRAAALGLVVALTIWFWRGTPAERRFLLRYVPALSVTALILSYTLGNPYPQLGWWDAFTRTTHATGLEAVTSERTRFWAATLRHALTSPWIGYGADNYLYMQPAQIGNQPHNVLLQWFLEYGLLGALPLVGLILRGVSGALVRPAVGVEPDRPFRVWACAALAGATAYGLFDGVFYHMIIFMPVAVIAGVAIGQSNPSGDAPGFVVRTHPLGRLLLLGALSILVLHGWLFLMLIRGRNVRPDSPPARILRVFPSITYGLRNWIEAWRTTQPEVAMEWIKWAESAAIEQGTFHVYAAQLYIWKKDYKSAEAELLLCLGKVSYIERSDVQEALAHVRRLAAEQDLKRAPQPGAAPVKLVQP